MCMPAGGGRRYTHISLVLPQVQRHSPAACAGSLSIKQQVTDGTVRTGGNHSWRNPGSFAQREPGPLACCSAAIDREPGRGQPASQPMAVPSHPAGPGPGPSLRPGPWPCSLRQGAPPPAQSPPAPAPAETASTRPPSRTPAAACTPAPPAAQPAWGGRREEKGGEGGRRRWRRCGCCVQLYVQCKGGLRPGRLPARLPAALPGCACNAHHCHSSFLGLLRTPSPDPGPLLPAALPSPFSCAPFRHPLPTPPPSPPAPHRDAQKGPRC